VPEREFGPESLKSLSKGSLELLLILERAHEESAMKSHRRAHGWKRARDKARANGTPVMKLCPAWLEVTPDGYRIKEGAAAVVRRIFSLCLDGMGTEAITNLLVSEQAPTPGRSGGWNRSYVHRLLTNPAVIGTYQPHRKVAVEVEAKDGKRLRQTRRVPTASRSQTCTRPSSRKLTGGASRTSCAARRAARGRAASLARPTCSSISPAAPSRSGR
jgi:hypothetical protein